MVGEEMASEAKGGPNGREERIVVSVRLRPLNDKEIARNDGCDWQCVGRNTLAINAGLIADRSMFPSAYTFDRVFGFDCSTKQVYDEGAKEVILSVVSGINSSVFAYGQTSSGKTYTMNGLTECAVEDIYNIIEMDKGREFVLKFSAMEIYNEAVRDLLSADSTPLRLLDDPEKGTVVEKLIEKVLRDRDHLLELLSVCAAQRRIGETSLNETSSRSHQILRLTIESSAREYKGVGSSSTLTATVNFVDLAGSERASQTLSTGARLKEGSHINRSLLTLGTVIRKLSKGKNSHIPYRDSKLTRILQNSLGGNARTAIICTLSPARSHIEQSRNALFFASCAKEVATNAKVNLVVSDKALVKQLKRELAKIENELKSLTSKPVTSDSSNLLKEKELLIEQMDREIQELRKQRDRAESRIESMLGSVREDKVSKPDEHLRSESTMNEIRIDELSMFSFNKHQRQLSQTSEDSFLLDNNTPRFVDPDTSLSWENIAQETEPNPEEDECKEVRCIEADNTVMDQKREEFDTLIPIFEEKEGNEEHRVPIPVAPDSSYEALQQRIQYMQRTINCLVNLYPAEESPYHSEARMSSSRGSKLARSRSCRAVLTTSNSFIWSKDVQHNENTSFAVDSPGSVHNFWWKMPRSGQRANFENLSRKDSHSSTLSVSFDEDEYKESHIEAETYSKGSAPRARANHEGISIKRLLTGDPSASVLTSPLRAEQMKQIDVDHNSEEFYGGEKGLRRKLLKAKYGAKAGRFSRKHSSASVLSAPPERYDSKDSDSEDNVSVLNFNAEQKESFEPHYGSQRSEDLEQQAHRGALQTNSSWPFEFEKRRQEIIELWDSCHVPLVHRTYFFLLFKGDPSDSVYFEVELRRLSFLKEAFSLGSSVKKDSQIPTPASSMKNLNREREMLSKQVHKKFTRKEREQLYQQWGIVLSTKKRSLQLARRLWTNMSNLEHLRESAILVAKLVGIAEAAHVPKETFGLTFSPQPTNRKSFLWRHSLSSLS